MTKDSGIELDELKRVRRVVDMLCTAHAGLRDRYARRALCLELIILGASTWLVALVFVGPRINVSLTPWGLDPQIWIGTLGILTFFLTILQMKVDWKGTSDAHRRALALLAEVKHECGSLFTLGRECSVEQHERLMARYELVSKLVIEIPEKEFLKQKRRHRVKVEVSRHLDRHPGASILLFKIRLWLKDNTNYEVDCK